MGNNLSILATTASINVEQGLDQTINSMGVKQKKKKKEEVISFQISQVDLAGGKLEDSA